MKTSFPNPEQSGSEQAFTLSELLAIIVMMTVLALLPLRAVSVSKEEVYRGQCASNLRQAALALHMLASESNGRLPNAGGGGAWMWDMSAPTANSIAQYIPRERLYCPGSGFTRLENDRLWNSFGVFRVLGYAPTLAGTPGLISSNVNQTIIPQRIQQVFTSLPAPNPSERVLWADATISRMGQNNNALRYTYSYTDIFGAFTHRTPHMDGAFPLGGNLAMLDGHVEWRPFAEMRVRGPVGAASSPTFWW